MFLSRVRVVTQGMNRDDLLKLLSGDAYGNHQLLWQLFTKAEERPFLFRQEMEKEQLDFQASPRGLPLFYVLSTREPEPVSGLLECESKSFNPQLELGDRLLFKLRANPTIARKKEGEQRSRRHDVLMDTKWRFRQQGSDSPWELQEAMDASAEQWLESRCAEWGFSLDTKPQVSGYRQHQWRRKQGQIRFSSVDYEGVITVTDPERLRTALFAGVGRSRAFGCGMLLVRRG